MIDPESASLDNMKKQLDALQVFMASPAYSSFQATTKADIAAVEQSILSNIPDSQATIAVILLLHGERNALTSRLNSFEDARTVLTTAIADRTGGS